MISLFIDFIIHRLHYHSENLLGGKMLKKCEKCGRFFGDDTGGNICSACKLSNTKFKTTGNIERDKFICARDLVYDNPDISPQGIIEYMADLGIDITLREIMKYVDEGRLSLNTIKEGNHCIKCGTKIGFGKYCDRCRIRLEHEGNSVHNSDDEQSNRIKMHISSKK